MVMGDCSMDREKVVVLVSEYRTKEKPYTNVFVHSRVKAYLEYGIDAFVFVLNEKLEFGSYTIDGVDVITGQVSDFIKVIEEQNIQSVCAHFLCAQMIKAFDLIKERLNIVIVVHGNEALHWYQRLFPGILSNYKLFLGTIRGAFYNQYGIRKIRNFLNRTNHNIEFVTVSNWMKDMAEKTWKCQGKYRWNIIPNVVLTERFQYCPKKPDDRYRLLSIRPFASGKYANDITANLIRSLIKHKGCSDFSFTWIGAGVLYKKTVSKVRGFNNITLINRMLQQEEIPAYHKENGLFICPTRQDAQGVSMCEAMSSGLIPITLANTAIPEFLPDERLICHDINEMRQLIISLFADEKLFFELSEKCSEYIKVRCSFDNTIMKEIDLLKRK